MKTYRVASRFPLAWPLGWKRTPFPRRARYKLTFGRALDELVHELRLMASDDIVVSTNIEPRLNGAPRTSAPEPRDAGVAVYWTDAEGRARVMACDAWDCTRANVRAVAVAIAALRQIERSGASQLLERAFTGFAALPADAGASPWRTVLGVDEGKAVTPADVEAAWRKRVMTAHPDRGGSHELIISINAARDEALRELRGACGLGGHTS